MYLCGHPGTGKSSSLNHVLQQLRRDGRKGKIDEYQLFMYNAMAYTDVKNFTLSLLQEATEKKTGEHVSRLSRQAYDDEELAMKVAKVLSGKAKPSSARRKQLTV